MSKRVAIDLHTHEHRWLWKCRFIKIKYNEKFSASATLQARNCYMWLTATKYWTRKRPNTYIITETSFGQFDIEKLKTQKQPSKN